MKERKILKMIRFIIPILVVTPRFSSTNIFKSFFEENKNILKESLTALIICAMGDLCAGIILGNMTFFLETFPGLLVLIPGAIGLRGNIFGSFGSRISTNLHIGTLEPKFKKSKVLLQNIFSSLILTLLLSFFLAILSKGICIAFGFKSMAIYDFILISLFAGIISAFIMLPITMFIAIKSFENGWDPDNVTTPIIAAFGDLFTLPAILLAIFILNMIKFKFIKISLVIFFIIMIILSFIYGYRYSEESRNILKQSSPILIVCSLLGVFAGSVFNGSLSTLLTNPSLLTLMPLFSGESGSLISILGARLSSGLHSGLIEPVLKLKKETLSNFLISIILGIVMYPIIAILADTSSVLLGSGGLGLIKIIPISFLSGIILLSIMMFIVFFISTKSYMKGFDPDNIVIPISTSLTDSVSSLILISVSLLILAIFI